MIVVVLVMVVLVVFLVCHAAGLTVGAVGLVSHCPAGFDRTATDFSPAASL